VAGSHNVSPRIPHHHPATKSLAVAPNNMSGFAKEFSIPNVGNETGKIRCNYIYDKRLIDIMRPGFEYLEVLMPHRADTVYGFVIPELQLRGDEGSFLLVEKVSKFEKYVRHCQ
jgi:hypothetical protein